MEEDSTDRTRCGVLSFRPKCLQKYAKVNYFIIVLCFVFFASDGFAGYMVGCITTIEKRFQFSSSKSGFLMSAGTVMYTVFVIFAAHYGRGNKPRSIAAGMFLSGCGMFLTALPHFIYGAGDSSEYASGVVTSRNLFAAPNLDLEFGDEPQNKAEFCSENNPTTDPGTCSEVDRSNIIAYLLILAGISLQQVGCTTFFTLGLSYVDDNLKRSSDAPWYVGILSTARPIGPAFGLLLSSFSLSIYVEPFTDTDLDPSDPKWIGAWWFGVIVFCGITFLTFPFAASFPVHLPGKRRLDDLEEAKCTASIKNDEGLAADNCVLPKEKSDIPGFTPDGEKQVDQYAEPTCNGLIGNDGKASDIYVVPKDKPSLPCTIPQGQKQAVLYTEPTSDGLIGVDSKAANAAAAATDKLATLSPKLSKKNISPGEELNGTLPSQTAEPAPNEENDTINMLEYLKSHPKELAKRLCKLFTNVVYMCVTLGICFKVYTLVAYFLFLPKYLEVQFHLTASAASAAAGAWGVFMCIGLLLGGFIMRRYRMLPKGGLTMILICVLSVLLMYVPMMLIGCTELDYAGEQDPDTGMLNITMDCNANCLCSRLSYSPVCGIDGKTYFSGCHAGCTSTISLDDTLIYNNCACITDPEAPNATGTAQEKRCSVSCNLELVLYIALMMVSSVAGTPAEVAAVVIQFRSVEKDNKPLALALSGVLICVLTYIPGPLISGALVDSTCMLWQEDECGKTGACWIYDKEKFRFVIHGLSIITLLLSSVFYSTAYLVQKGPLFEDPPDSETTSECYENYGYQQSEVDPNVEQTKF